MARVAWDGWAFSPMRGEDEQPDTPARFRVTWFQWSWPDYEAVPHASARVELLSYAGDDIEIHDQYDLERRLYVDDEWEITTFWASPPGADLLAEMDTRYDTMWWIEKGEDPPETWVLPAAHPLTAVLNQDWGNLDRRIPVDEK